MTTGLRSLSEKIQALESKMASLSINEESSDSNGFVNVSINKVLASRENKIRSDLKSLEDSFHRGLEKNSVDVSSPEMVITNLSEIVHYSVKFIEIHAERLASILNVEKSSTFKLENCLLLLKSVVRDLISDTALVNWICHFVRLLYPHKEDISYIAEDPEKASIRSSSSIKRAGRFILKRSGCK